MMSLQWSRNDSKGSNSELFKKCLFPESGHPAVTLRTAKSGQKQTD